MNNVISRAMKTSLLLSVLASSMTHSMTTEYQKRQNKLKSDPELQKLESETQNQTNPFLYRKMLLAFGVGMGIGGALEGPQLLFGKDWGLITVAEKQVGKAGMSGAVVLSQGVTLLLEVGRDQRQKIEGDDTKLNNRDQTLVNTAGYAGGFVGKFLINSIYNHLHSKGSAGSSTK